MDGLDVIDVLRDGIFVMLKLAAPMVLTGLFLGVIVSLIQAITQIQEMTLTFVPKMLATMGVLVYMMPNMINMMVTFANELFGRIATLP